jgi:hypothetical protein
VKKAVWCECAFCDALIGHYNENQLRELIEASNWIRMTGHPYEVWICPVCIETDSVCEREVVRTIPIEQKTP